MPVEVYSIDDRTRVRVGYPDGHIEVEVDLPFPLSAIQATATRSFSAEAVLSVVPAVRKAINTAARATGVARRA